MMKFSFYNFWRARFHRLGFLRLEKDGKKYCNRDRIHFGGVSDKHASQLDVIRIVDRLARRCRDTLSDRMVFDDIAVFMHF